MLKLKKSSLYAFCCFMVLFGSWTSAQLIQPGDGPNLESVESRGERLYRSQRTQNPPQRPTVTPEPSEEETTPTPSEKTVLMPEPPQETTAKAEPEESTTEERLAELEEKTETLFGPVLKQVKWLGIAWTIAEICVGIFILGIVLRITGKLELGRKLMLYSFLTFILASIGATIFLMSPMIKQTFKTYETHTPVTPVVEPEKKEYQKEESPPEEQSFDRKIPVDLQNGDAMSIEKAIKKQFPNAQFMTNLDILPGSFAANFIHNAKYYQATLSDDTTHLLVEQKVVNQKEYQVINSHESLFLWRFAQKFPALKIGAISPDRLILTSEKCWNDYVYREESICKENDDYIYFHVTFSLGEKISLQYTPGSVSIPEDLIRNGFERYAFSEPESSKTNQIKLLNYVEFLKPEKENLDPTVLYEEANGKIHTVELSDEAYEKIPTKEEAFMEKIKAEGGETLSIQWENLDAYDIHNALSQKFSNIAYIGGINFFAGSTTFKADEKFYKLEYIWGFPTALLTPETNTDEGESFLKFDTALEEKLAPLKSNFSEYITRDIFIENIQSYESGDLEEYQVLQVNFQKKSTLEKILDNNNLKKPIHPLEDLFEVKIYFPEHIPFQLGSKYNYKDIEKDSVIELNVHQVDKNILEYWENKGYFHETEDSSIYIFKVSEEDNKQVSDNIKYLEAVNDMARNDAVRDLSLLFEDKTPVLFDDVVSLKTELIMNGKPIPKPTQEVCYLYGSLKDTNINNSKHIFLTVTSEKETSIRAYGSREMFDAFDKRLVHLISLDGKTYGAEDRDIVVDCQKGVVEGVSPQEVIPGTQNTFNWLNLSE